MQAFDPNPGFVAMLHDAPFGSLLVCRIGSSFIGSRSDSKSIL